MGKGNEKEGVLMVSKKNQLTQLKTSYKEFETVFKNCLIKMSSLFKPVVEVAGEMFSGAIIGTGGGMARNVLCYCLPLQPYNSLEASNWIAMNTVNGGVSCVVKKFIGKEDIRTSMVIGLGVGYMWSLLYDLKAEAIANGVSLALFNGITYKLFREKWSREQAEDVWYSETRGVLSSLGLDRFEKNFKKGLLTDHTLPLLSDSHLKEVKIPAGARVRILDHIKREKEKQEECKSA